MTIAPERPAAGLPTRPAAATNPLAWQSEALCAQVDPELFHPELGGTAAIAKRICLGCPVRRDCLEYALEHGENHGVWGATSPDQRRAIRRARDTRRPS